jgi:hypothetical protein
MKAMLLPMATMRSGTIVFMKNDEKTRMADNQPAITINIATSFQESKGTPVCGRTVMGPAESPPAVMRPIRADDRVR